MQRILIIVLVLAVVLGFMVTYVVRFNEAAVVTTFGKADSTSVVGDAGLRFKALPWLRPDLGVAVGVESPIQFVLAPGIRWHTGVFYVRTALAAMVAPETAAGFLGALGADIPLGHGWFLPVEAGVTVWSAKVMPVDFRLGVGYVF